MQPVQPVIDAASAASAPAVAVTASTAPAPADAAAAPPASASAAAAADPANLSAALGDLQRRMGAVEHSLQALTDSVDQRLSRLEAAHRRADTV